MFGQAMNPIIRADGNPKFAMFSTLAGAAINIVLDPIFIFVCKWGMMGAAVATVIGQIATAGLAVWYLLYMKIINPASADYVLKKNICERTLILGITSFLSQISLVAAMAAINNMLRKYGALDIIFGQEQYAQIPMAVVGIVMKFFQIVISIVVGMAAGCIPIIGYNMGAEKKCVFGSCLQNYCLQKHWSDWQRLCWQRDFQGNLSQSLVQRTRAVTTRILQSKHSVYIYA